MKLLNALQVQPHFEYVAVIQMRSYKGMHDYEQSLLIQNRHNWYTNLLATASLTLLGEGVKEDFQIAHQALLGSANPPRTSCGKNITTGRPKYPKPFSLFRLN